MAKEVTRPFPRCPAVLTADSIVEQCHRSVVDVNNIVKKYHATGSLPQRLSRGVYGDFTNMTDYHDCVNRVNDALSDFAALPSVIRKRFGNDPAQLLAFLEDENNRAEAMELGLIPRVDQAKQDKSDKPADKPVDGAGK